MTLIKQKGETGMPLESAVREGCLERLRFVPMAALVAAVELYRWPSTLGWAEQCGVLWPPWLLVNTNTLLTLVAVPILYVTFGRARPRRRPLKTLEEE